MASPTAKWIPPKGVAVDEALVTKSKKMAVVYTAICAFENSVREFIEKKFFYPFLKLCEFSQKTIDLFAEDEEIKNFVMGIVTDSDGEVPKNVFAIHKLLKPEIRTVMQQEAMNQSLTNTF